MKTFIWTSEYDLFIANAETKEEAIKMLLDKSIEEFKENDFDKEDFEEAIKKEPLVLLVNECTFIEHSNQ